MMLLLIKSVLLGCSMWLGQPAKTSKYTYYNTIEPFSSHYLTTAPAKHAWIENKDGFCVGLVMSIPKPTGSGRYYLAKELWPYPFHPTWSDTISNRVLVDTLRRKFNTRYDAAMYLLKASTPPRE